MFVVVAIVIFGIFVALSYTVFGDNLGQPLHTMFLDASRQTNVRVNGFNVVESNQRTLSLDFDRTYLDTGDNFHTYIRETLVWNGETNNFETNYIDTRNDRLTEISGFWRLYTILTHENLKGNTIEDAVLKVNGKTIDTKLDIRHSAVYDTASYFIESKNGDPLFEVGNTYRFDLYLIAENGDAFHYYKNLYINDNR